MAETASKITVLVVDDDPDISMMLRLMLEFNGYNVQTTEKPEETISLMQESNIHVVIMDMLLSGVNGTDICAQLKNHEKIGHIPLIMISAHPNAREICLEAGADDFISKPFDMQDILSKIRQFAGK